MARKVFKDLKTIFIANIGEEDSRLIRFSQNSRQEEMIRENYALAERFIYSTGEDSILVTPNLLPSEYLTDVKNLLDLKNLINLTTKITHKLLCRSLLADTQTLETLIDVIKQNPGISLTSAIASEEFFELINFLQKKGLHFKTPEAPSQSYLWTTPYFDSKAGFRQTVLYLNHDFPHLPQGMICSRSDEIKGWVNYFFRHHKDCLLKTNRGSAGVGIKILRQKEFVGKNIENAVDLILQSQPYWQKEAVVVEEYIEPDFSICGGAPDVEFKVKEDGWECLYCCGMRIDSKGHFKGVEIGKEAVPLPIANELIKSGQTLAKFFWHCGYRGFFDIDFVNNRKGELYPIEANLRRTGGTHVWEVGRRLLGLHFLKEYYLASGSLLSAPRFKNKDYPQIKRALTEVLYPIKNQKEGILLSYTNYFHDGRLGYMVIASDKKQAYQIEAEFLKKLN